MYKRVIIGSAGTFAYCYFERSNMEWTLDLSKTKWKCVEGVGLY